MGMVIQDLRDYFIPKHPILPSSDVFPHPGMADFNEWSLYRGWMALYLKYLQWYCQVALDPCVHIDAFVEAPVFIRTWYIPEVDLSTFRFGIMFRILEKYIYYCNRNINNVFPDYGSGVLYQDTSACILVYGTTPWGWSSLKITFQYDHYKTVGVGESEFPWESYLLLGILPLLS